MIPTVQAVTFTAADLGRSKRFYEEVLGFEADVFYAPTRWQSFRAQGRAYFCIAEVPNYRQVESANIINFDVEDVEQYWNAVKDRAPVDAPLQQTPWGSLKFVVQDPDGNRLGFVGKR